MTRTAYEVQRDFALSSGLRSEIIWDSLDPDQAHVLKQKIENLICESEHKNPRSVAKQRQVLFNNVWMQRKYTSRVLLSSIIYVLVTNETDPEVALSSTNFSCHPVFRSRRCMKAENSGGCCMNFIDEHGRVYSNWGNYVYNNALPKGLMIAPSQGVYKFNDDEDSGVHLMIHHTPSSRVKYKILSAGDTVASLGGLVASVPVAATLALPVAGPILMVATAVGAATAAYGTARSVAQLFDRRRHGQSTSIRDSEARGSWLGVAGGVVGLGASGATKALSIVAGTGGEVNAAAQLAVKGINVSSIVISGTGVVNGVYDLYLKVSDEQALSSFDVLKIASSLVLFTHSINNLRIASKVTNGSSLRRALRNQTRKVFDQISRETIKLHGTSGSQKFDIIRTLNDIPFKEVLLSLHKINSHLTQGASVLGAVGASMLPNLVSLGAGGYMRLNMETLEKKFGSKFVQHISNLHNFMDVLDALARYLSEQALELLLQMACTFVEQNVDGIDRTLNTFVSTETVVYRMLMHCVNNYKDFTVDFLSQRRMEIMAVVQKYFHSLQAVNNPSSRKFKCATCKGAYYICDL